MITVWTEENWTQTKDELIINWSAWNKMCPWHKIKTSFSSSQIWLFPLIGVASLQSSPNTCGHAPYFFFCFSSFVWFCLLSWKSNDRKIFVYLYTKKIEYMCFKVFGIVQINKSNQVCDADVLLRRVHFFALNWLHVFSACCFGWYFFFAIAL